MIYARFRTQEGKILYGIQQGQDLVAVEGNIFGSWWQTEQRYPLDAVRLLAPCLPSKVMCAGTNYLSHIRECNEKMHLQVEIPEHPLIFSKAPNTIVGPGDTILYPTGVERVDFEGELGVVIKTRCKSVSPQHALDVVLGYTCLNDVSARTMQWGDGQWTRGKGLDTFCPIGPVITDEVDPTDLPVRTRVNGELLQDGTTRDLIFDIPALIAYISEWITLEPGDVIATGTPAGVGPIRSGDRVEVEIPGIGILTNPVQEA